MADKHHPITLDATTDGPSDLQPTRVENETLVRPRVVESPSMASKGGLVAVGVVVLLGTVFYGLNTAVLPPPKTIVVAQTVQADNATPPANDSGLTMGAATARARPPQANGASSDTK